MLASLIDDRPGSCGRRHPGRPGPLIMSAPGAALPIGEPARSGPLMPAGHGPVACARSGSYDLVLVGGVPGAGKTTAIARACDDLHHVTAIDPEHITWWLRRHLPPAVPYSGYRWLVHLVHTLRVLVLLATGPRAGRQLLIHDPGTRGRRRALLYLLMRLAGWRAILVYLDVDRQAAQDGQIRRGRVVRSFEAHWHRWHQLRPALLGQAPTGSDVASGSAPVLLVDRADAAAVLRRICRA